MRAAPARAASTPLEEKPVSPEPVTTPPADNGSRTAVAAPPAGPKEEQAPMSAGPAPAAAIPAGGSGPAEVWESPEATLRYLAERAGVTLRPVTPQEQEAAEDPERIVDPALGGELVEVPRRRDREARSVARDDVRLHRIAAVLAREHRGVHTARPQHPRGRTGPLDHRPDRRPGDVDGRFVGIETHQVPGSGLPVSPGNSHRSAAGFRPGGERPARHRDNVRWFRLDRWPAGRPGPSLSACPSGS